jgi:hypothetical protein
MTCFAQASMLAGYLIEPVARRRTDRTLKTGTISFDCAASIDCVVRNVSETGRRFWLG